MGTSLCSAEVFTIYRDKDTIAEGFDDLKNHLDMCRLLTHTTETTDGKRLMNPLAKTPKNILGTFDITENDIKAYVAGI